MIDLRSDFCATATEEMWEAMREAELGWPVAGDDSSVNELERIGAELLGKESAAFVPTCTAANLAAVLVLAPRGGRAALDGRSHILVNEGGWLTEIAGLTAVGLDEAGAADVLCLENTHTRRGGTVLTPEATAELAARAPRVHLDGARLPNAAVALGVSLAELAAPCDTVALSLNKGLCAPFGALLAGEGATIAAARAHLKRLGAGTVHKAGIFAAAGVVALERMVDRIADDHRRARDLASRIGAEAPETNIVYADLPAGAVAELAARGIRALELEGRVRFVTHRGIGDAEIEATAAAVGAIAAHS